VIVCRTLGSLEVTVDGAPAPSELLWRKHLALLIYLARSPRHSRSREHLIGLLWGDRTDASARHSLSEALRVIRRHAGQAAVEVSVGQVGLATGVVELDVDRLEVLAAAGDWTGAAGLVAGEFLEGFAVPDASLFEDWLAAERTSWRRRGIEVLVRCADGLARSGRAQEGVALAARALALEPSSEPAVRAALRAQALAGDRAGALELFDRFHARLAQLGVEPGEETRVRWIAFGASAVPAAKCRRTARTMSRWSAPRSGAGPRSSHGCSTAPPARRARAGRCCSCSKASPASARAVC
jgi:DNA-binding transcriptional activator of the SARP family